VNRIQHSVHRCAAKAIRPANSLRAAKAALDGPVVKYLPLTVTQRERGRKIMLLDLANYDSGVAPGVVRTLLTGSIAGCVIWPGLQYHSFIVPAEGVGVPIVHGKLM